MPGTGTVRFFGFTVPVPKTTLRGQGSDQECRNCVGESASKCRGERGLEGPGGCWVGDPAVWGSGVVGYCRDCCGGT